MWMFHLSKHSKLINNHLLVSFDILLQDDLDCDLLPLRPFGFSDNAIGSCAKGFAKFVFGSVVISVSGTMSGCGTYFLS
jgi:hypothetical protein